MPGKLSQFWKELKRRRVPRLMAVYAGSAYVIFEASTLIFPRWGLPDWSIDLVLYLLVLGIIITFIVGWVYNITPEGIEKTTPLRQDQDGMEVKDSTAWRIATFASILVIICLIVFHILSGKGKERSIFDLEKSIAVLPFEYYNMDPEAEDIGDAFTNEIITQLYKIKGFDRIISHTSSLQYKGSNRPSIPTIGGELNVNFIIEGSLEQQKDSVAIQVQVIESVSDDHLWADEFRGSWDEIFSIRADIAKKIAEELKTILTRDEEVQIEEKPTENVIAYELYLLANQNSLKYNEESILKAITLYESAIELDPEFALAYVGMGKAYMSLFWEANWLPGDAYGKAREAIVKALEINDQLAETHAALANIRLSYDWDLEKAEKDFKRAIDLNPNLPDIYSGYKSLLEIMCRYEECHLRARQALYLNPNSVDAQNYYSYSFFNIGHADSAITYLKEQTKSHPESLGAHYLLGCTYLFTGAYEDAIEELEIAVEMDSISQPYRFYLGIAYARMGVMEETRMHLEKFEELEKDSRTVSFGKAVLLAELGVVDSAIYWLQRSFEERYRHLLYLKTVQTMFEPVRSDPGFLEVYHKIWPEQTEHQGSKL
jgi:TolB-like protein/Tfp pilus assembly protein PilF